jgi:hypothetical protein
MIKVKLYFTRTAGADDILQIFETEEYFDMAKIVYTPGDHAKKSNVFYLSRADVLTYVSTIFKSMDNDTDPFEYVQIESAIHPSVMIPIVDLAERETRWQLEDMVEQALYANVEEIKLKRNVRTPVRGY